MNDIEKLEKENFDPVLIALVRRAMPALKAYTLVGIGLNEEEHAAASAAFDKGEHEKVREIMDASFKRQDADREIFRARWHKKDGTP